jgi:hypothetical protein
MIYFSPQSVKNTAKIMQKICVTMLQQSVYRLISHTNRLLKNVMSEAETRKKGVKKRSLHTVNEHFEPLFDAVSASAIVFQQPVKVRFIKSYKEWY